MQKGIIINGNVSSSDKTENAKKLRHHYCVPRCLEKSARYEEDQHYLRRESLAHDGIGTRRVDIRFDLDNRNLFEESAMGI